MLAQARARVPAARVAELSQLAGVRGAIVANEVHDACPAHRLRWPAELLVDVGPDRRFRLVEGPDAGALGDALLAAGVEPRAGGEYEVSPAQAELQRTLAGALERGSLIGLAGGDPLSAPGTQDITVDVDFGAVRRAGEAAGLRTALDVSQGEWLLAHGAGAEIATRPRHDPERLWLEALSEPEGSGGAFRVLVQERA
jgi:SAM-dependent MidA family methyltransferase